MLCKSPLFGFECAVHNSIVGVDDGEGPPVPIPNTEVKLIDGENTCLATDRENSKMPTQNRSCESSCGFLYAQEKKGQKESSESEQVSVSTDS